MSQKYDTNSRFLRDSRSAIGLVEFQCWGGVRIMVIKTPKNNKHPFFTMCLSSLRTPRPQQTSDSEVAQDVRSTNQGEKRRHPHIIVQHNYHDHAGDAKPASYKDSDSQRGGVSTPFPLKLHEMLNSVEADACSHIVSWQPHGRCFVVHKPGLFKDLLPRYFKLSKIASFQRQLNLYGFQRLTRGNDKGG